MAADDLSPRVASPQDRDDVVAILVSAFYDDPTWSWAFPDPSLRGAQHRRLWGTDLSQEQEAALKPTIVEMLGEDAPVIHAFELFDQAHPRELPHFYLSLLATSAAHRGRGHGLGLLAENLRLIDEAGMPAYPEASNPANVALYSRHGFEVRWFVQATRRRTRGLHDVARHYVLDELVRPSPTIG